MFGFFWNCLNDFGFACYKVGPAPQPETPEKVSAVQACWEKLDLHIQGLERILSRG